jgi:hypothetical protein
MTPHGTGLRRLSDPEKLSDAELWPGSGSSAARRVATITGRECATDGWGTCSRTECRQTSRKTPSLAPRVGLGGAAVVAIRSAQSLASTPIERQDGKAWCLAQSSNRVTAVPVMSASTIWPATWVRLASLAADAQRHRGHDNVAGTQRAYCLLQPTPRIPRHVDPTEFEQLAKSGPDSWVVNGWSSGGQPLARTAGRADHLELHRGGGEAIT